MQTITFTVQGSSETPYQVIFGNDGKSVICSCSCMAAQMGQPCKHRNRIIIGVGDGIIGDFGDDLAVVQSWVRTSPLAPALANLEAAEARLADAKKVVAAAKKALAAAMET